MALMALTVVGVLMLLMEPVAHWLLPHLPQLLAHLLLLARVLLQVHLLQVVQLLRLVRSLQVVHLLILVHLEPLHLSLLCLMLLLPVLSLISEAQPHAPQRLRSLCKPPLTPAVSLSARYLWLPLHAL